MYLFLKILFYIPFRIIFPYRVIGRKNLKKVKGRAIYAPNHQSAVDPLICGSFLRNDIYYIGKKDLFKNKFSAWFLTKLHTYPVDKNRLDLSVIKRTRKILKDEKGLVIFPQGTRKKMADDFDGMKSGAIFFATKFTSPIVPIYFVRKPRPFVFNTIVIGEPIYYDKYYENQPTKEELTECSDELISIMNNLKNYRKKQDN